jgi:methionyl-tRNA formyltransferase
MKLIFMGTPDFAVPTLESLIRAGHEVRAVVTAADKPAGRGRQLQSSPVKQAALNHSIPVLQPEKLRDPDFLQALSGYEADLFVVVAFRMLPEVVWQMPPKGTINLHASLLPDYRGAAPINHVLINGETETGATTFFIEKEIDTGQILLQYNTPISPEWNAGDLHDHLSIKGADLVVETLAGLEAGMLQPRPQDISLALHAAPKIFRETCKLDFHQPASALHNLVRGLSPYPGAWCTANGMVVKIYKTAPAMMFSAPPVPGKVLKSGKHLLVSGKDAWLEILELQPEGKKRMEASAFLLGHDLPEFLNS